MLNNKLKTALFGVLATCGSLWLTSCNNTTNKEADNALSDTARIVSINGAVTEVIAGLGLEKQIVGVDVASTYPESLAKLPRVGHSRQMSSEGILALNPTLIVGTKADVKPELADQLQKAGVRVILFDHQFSADGSKQLIHAVADSLGYTAKGDSIVTALEQDLKAIPAAKPDEKKPKVLFIYARGAGTMMVAGEDTPVAEIIKLANADNAGTGFKDFKPFTSEALVSANPDVLLLFDTGLESLGGTDGLLEIQGVKETNAGKNKKFVTMDGQLLTGFSPRLGKAIAELHQKIHE